MNPAALETASRNGVEVYTDADQVADDSVDVLISNHALDHTLNPLQELKTLLHKVRKGGKVVFFVPCDSIRVKYKPKDVNHHLYTWNLMCLGNLFADAGSQVSDKDEVERIAPHVLEDLGEAASIARRSGASFGIIYSPFRGAGWEQPHYRMAFDRLSQWVKAHGIEFLDLSPAYAAVSPGEIYQDGMHLSATGNEVAANAIASEWKWTRVMAPSGR